MNKTSASCDLCGLPLGHAAISLDISPKTYCFCCPGCRQVFNLLLEAAGSADPKTFRDTELFQKCRDIGIIPQSEEDLIGRDQPFRAGRAQTKSTGAPAPSRQLNPPQAALGLTLKVDNMWCPACAWVIEAYFKKTPGIISANCNFSTDYLRCDYDPVATTPDNIADTIRSLGYRTLLPGEKDTAGKRSDSIRLGVSAFLTANVMMLSFALYSGFFSELSVETVRHLSWPIFFMTAVVFFYGGINIYRKALTGFVAAAFGLETLVTIGSTCAFLFSIVNLVKGSIHLYFDTTCMLITLVLLGKLLEKNAKDKVRTDIEAFFSLRPSKAKICSAQYPRGRYVSADSLQAGDVFLATENETIAGDGVVLEGNAAVDESALTGEARPVRIESGDRVRSGTRVLQGGLRVKAESVGADSTIGQMIAVMEQALSAKTPLEEKSDRVLRLFVPAVLLLAVVTVAGCLLAGLSFEHALIRMVTVLVIACPCSLGIAIPLTRMAGISLAAKSGILVRNFRGIEKAGRLAAVVFDKTGTLTHGRWELIDLVPFTPFTSAQVMSLAVSLEKDSDHYIAVEIRRYAQEHHLSPADVAHISHSENGISGRHNNAEVKIGSSGYLQKELAALPDDQLNNLKDSPAIRSFVYMSIGGKPCAALIFGDRIKAGTADVVRQLHMKGVKTYLVSGDGVKTTDIVAGSLGIRESFGGMLPRQKADFIEKLQESGLRVAMVGDGINDAPALIQADLSVAVHSGSHLGKEVADITLMRSDPLQVMELLALAGRINSKISQNLIFSFIYNTGSLPIAMSGLLNPLIAVSAMLLSSLTVIGNTLLMMRSRPMTSADAERPGA
ncbi:MAG: heavy metal translocating P-type ATPase [Desulfobacterales bacterium]|nr:heavy metal translocating P-type ATPase [Desulfobacterales bacterium]